MNARPHIGHRPRAGAGRRAGPLPPRARRRRPVPGRHRRQLAEERAGRRGGRASACGSSSTATPRRSPALGGALSLTVDDFIRTSRDPRHRPGVERFWRACAGRRPVPQAVRGAVLHRLRAVLHPGRTARRPLPRARDRAAAGQRGELVLPAVPLRRAAARGDHLRPAADRARPGAATRCSRSSTAGWRTSRCHGPPGGPAAGASRCPATPARSIYVWFDALCNYVTALGYGEDGGGATGGGGPARESRVHLLGKGVLRFHAVYWPAMLLSSGQPLPTDIFVHDYLTAGGRKISKSGSGRGRAGAGRAGRRVRRRRGALVAAPRGAAGGRRRFHRRAAGRPGRRRARQRPGQPGQPGGRHDPPLPRRPGAPRPGGRPWPPAGEASRRRAARPATAVGAALEDFDFRQATAAVWAIADEANRFVNRARPWELARAEPGGAGAARRGARRSCWAPARCSAGS